MNARAFSLAVVAIFVACKDKTPPSFVTDDGGAASAPSSASPSNASDLKIAGNTSLHPEQHGLASLCGSAGCANDGPFADAGNGPRGTVVVSMDPMPTPDVERTILGTRARFRQCYNRALLDDPKIAGSITIAINIAADGTVTNAKPETRTVPTALMTCSGRIANNIEFPAQPAPWTAKISATFTLAK